MKRATTESPDAVAVGLADVELVPLQAGMEPKTARDIGGHEAPPENLRGARILMTTMYYRPETTGSAPYTADLAEHLVACGAQVRVVTMHPHYPQWRRPAGVANRLVREQVAGVDVIRVRGYVPRNPSLLRRAAYEASYVLAALPQLRGFEPDLVIAYMPSPFAAALGVRLARRHGVPCVTVVQDLITSAAAWNRLPRAGRAKAALSAVERGVIQNSALVTVSSSGFAPLIRRLAPCIPVEVVPNWSRLGADQPTGALDLNAAAARDAFRKRLGWTDRFVVAHTGTIGLKQGLEDLATALHHLAVAQPEVLVSFIGDGSRRAALVEATAGLSSAEVRDPVSDDDYPLLLRAADALLVHERRGSRDMSPPSELASYFAAGRPVVALVEPDSTTAAEIARSGAGIVVNRDDPTALAAELGRLHADPREANSLGTAGIAYAHEALRPGVTLNRLAQLLGDVLGAASRAGSPTT